MPINMNGSNDPTYRYKMCDLNLTVAGRGNGIYTIFENIDLVCKSLNHPVSVVMSYIATVTGSNYIESRQTLTGSHKTSEIIEIILDYIKHLVMCPKCNIPETIPRIEGNKKNTIVILCCSACKNETKALSINKKIDKGIDIIIKYLKAGNVWTTTKGTMVEQLSQSEVLESTNEDDKTTEENEEINPFDSI
jgi:translation initiation factor 2 beta subunit (eIF-2beta)/eIF-5